MSVARILWVLVLLALPCSIWAQDAITASAAVSKNPVSPGEAFKLSITVTNAEAKMEVPRIPGLQYIGGQGMDNRTYIANGQRVSNFTYWFTYRANTEGEIKIPSITVTTASGKVKTKPFTLTVKRNVNPEVNANFMTIVEPSRTKVYLGEPVVLRYKVYQRYGSLNIESYELPDIDGFWREEVPDHQGQWETKVINGQRYSEATLKVEVVFPQQTGSITIDGFSMTGIVGSFWNRQRVTSTPSSATIEVLPLPAGKPANFLGTFDNLTMTCETTRESLAANEALDLNIRFAGTGNLGLLQAPGIAWPPDLEVFDPEVQDRFSVSTNGIQGSRAFNYVIIPRSAGSYTLPELTFSYFNARKKSYETLTCSSTRLEVDKGAEGAAVDYSFNAKSDVQVLNKDIRYIRNQAGNLRPPAAYFFGSLPFYLSYAAPFGLFTILLLYRRKQKLQVQDVAGTRRKNAGRNLRKWLRQAEQDQSDQHQFYASLHRGLEAYIMDKFSLERSEVTRKKVNQVLSATPEVQRERFLVLWDKCEASRFAPVSSADTRKDLQEAQEVIRQMEAL